MFEIEDWSRKGISTPRMVLWSNAEAYSCLQVWVFFKIVSLLASKTKNGVLLVLYGHFWWSYWCLVHFNNGTGWPVWRFLPLLKKSVILPKSLHRSGSDGSIARAWWACWPCRGGSSQHARPGECSWSWDGLQNPDATWRQSRGRTGCISWGSWWPSLIRFISCVACSKFLFESLSAWGQGSACEHVIVVQPELLLLDFQRRHQ